MIPSNDQKCHVGSPFDHLDLTNRMVQLITLLTLFDTNSCISGITWPKNNYIAHCFSCPDLMNTVVLLKMSLALEHQF